MRKSPGSFGTREINPLADPPFARLPQRRLLDQKDYRRVNRFQSTFHPSARGFLVQPGCRADAEHVCERRDAKPKKRSTKPGSMLFVAGSFFLAHRRLTLPISTHLGCYRP